MKLWYHREGEVGRWYAKNEVKTFEMTADNSTCDFIDVCLTSPSPVKACKSHFASGSASPAQAPIIICPWHPWKQRQRWLWAEWYAYWSFYHTHILIGILPEKMEPGNGDLPITVTRQLILSAIAQMLDRLATIAIFKLTSPSSIWFSATHLIS